MRNKPVFSLSPAIIKENFKMFWYLPALSFIAYFLAGIFPLMMNPHYLTDPNHWFLEECLQNWNAAFVCMLVAAPLIGAVVMLGFLHNPARAMTIHAQPFSRNKIFWSHVTTGWMMCLIPPAIMTVIYLIIAGMPMHSLHFGASSLAIITFFYGIFVLAGVLVGTSVMHVLLCGVFFGIVPLTMWLTWMYCENFLTGFYDVPEWMADFLFDTNPILWMLQEGGEWFTPLRALAYLAVGLAFLILAGLLYERARLERVGDSMLFRAAEEIITWLIVFVGMSVFGFFFYAYIDTKAAALIGMFFGTLLAFVIVKIVLNRSIKIVNRQNLLSLGAFALIAVVFAGCTMYDLTGYTRRVPDEEDVVSIHRNSFGYNDTFDYYYSNIEDELTAHQETLTSPEAIEAVVALHQYIVDNRLYDYDTARGNTLVYNQNGEEVYQGNFWVTFRYTLKSGSEMSRRFDFQLDQTSADLINAIVTSQEYKDDSALLDIFNVENINYIELYVNDYTFEQDAKFKEMTNAEYDEAYRNSQVNLMLKEPEDIEAFLAAMKKDHYSSTYTVKTSGSVDMTNTADRPISSSVTSETRVEIALDFMDISGTISLKPGTEGVLKEWTYTAPDEKSKPIGEARFSIRKGHNVTLDLLQKILEEEGYESHAEHIAQR